MTFDDLPVQLQALLNALASAMRSREPAVRARVERLRSEHPDHSADQLAAMLVASTRNRVAATGAAGGAAAILPGLGTLVAIGAAGSQALYALEQEVELVLGIAMIHGHELEGSDERLLEALVVLGIAGGAVKIRDDFLVAGGQRIAVEAFRRLPSRLATGAGTHIIARVLGRAAAGRAAGAVLRVAPLAVGMAAGAGFDWVAVTVLGRAARRYYGPDGPAARRTLSSRASSLSEDGGDVKGGD